MLEVSLNEVAYTVASGWLLIAGLAFLAYISYPHWFDRVRSWLFACTPRALWSDLAAVVILAFLTGMTAENLSNRIFDNTTWHGLNEANLRRAVVFDDAGKLTNLGRDLYDQGSLQEYQLYAATDVSVAANALYYTAKNIPYMSAVLISASFRLYKRALISPDLSPSYRRFLLS